MKNLLINEAKKYVESTIDVFHEKRIQRLKSFHTFLLSLDIHATLLCLFVHKARLDYLIPFSISLYRDNTSSIDSIAEMTLS
jgi:hypothetical protein